MNTCCNALRRLSDLVSFMKPDGSIAQYEGYVTPDNEIIYLDKDNNVVTPPSGSIEIPTDKVTWIYNRYTPIEKPIYTGVIYIADGTSIDDYAAVTNSFIAPQKLQSIAVTVLRAGETVSSGSVVKITTTAGVTNLLSNMSIALSVAQDIGSTSEILADGIEVQCFGNAAALIVYTYQGV